LEENEASDFCEVSCTVMKIGENEASDFCDVSCTRGHENCLIEIPDPSHFWLAAFRVEHFPDNLCHPTKIKP
jgi:hypothetical protein